MVSLVRGRNEPENRIPSEKSYFSFVAGLNTDASPLNFPDNFSSDEENFVLNIDGSRERRLGLALESSGQVINIESVVLNTTATVLDLSVDASGNPRGFYFTYDGTSYLISYDSSTQTLVLSTSFPTVKFSLPFTKIVIGGTTYNISDATLDITLVGSVFSYEWEWDSVSSFPALAATPALVAYASLTSEEGMTRTHHWRNVGGDPGFNLLVVQVGEQLRFYPDTEVVSENTFLEYVHLPTYKVGSATTSQIASSPVNTDFARGYLFVVGQYLKPFYVEWDRDNGKPIATEIDIRERDFEGIEDGFDNLAQPITEIASHKYNLLNKGWRSAILNTFFSDTGTYPSKNMRVSKALARQNTANVAEADWTRAFSSEKLINELFQDTPAPSGHFLRNPFDTTSVYISDGGDIDGSASPAGSNSFGIVGYVPNSNQLSIRTSGDHGVANGDPIFIKQNLLYYIDNLGDTDSFTINGNNTAIVPTFSITGSTSADPVVITTASPHYLQTGAHVTFSGYSPGQGTGLNGVSFEITVLSPTTFSIPHNGTSHNPYTGGATFVCTDMLTLAITLPDDFGSYLTPQVGLNYLGYGFYGTTYGLGTLGTLVTTVVSNPAGYTTDNRPTAVAFFAGRIWYAGTQHPNLSHKIFFSQIIENDTQYGKCYQVADPTDPDISDLVASDGGVIVIPELDIVHEIMAYNGRLLVFADNGIWEIAGGQEGYFKATSYAVRQISNVGCVNAASVIVAEGVPFFWGEGAIYAITQDSNSGYLTAQDITTGKIQKLMSSISKQAKQQVQSAYDRNSKKIYWLYDANSATTYAYGNWLVMDLRLNLAFSKFKNYSTTKDIRAIYDIENYQPDPTEYRNVKFLCFSKTDRKELTFAELGNTSYQDFGVDAPAFVETGYENSYGEGVEPARRRYGTHLMTFMKRTETGYTASGTQWVPVNPGGCLARYIWNWADTSNTGKWSPQQQAYRYKNVWIPSNTTDLMGEQVLTSKLKVRGTGKILQIRYDSQPLKDCHIYGWHLRIEINRDI